MVCNPSLLFACDYVHMRALMMALAASIYVMTDMAVNHGSAIRGSAAFISAMVRSVGL